MMMVEKMASLGQAGGGGGPRDQQPPGRHPHLRAAPAPAASRPRGRARRPRSRGRPTASCEMVDGEAGRCGDIVRNLLAFSRQSGARFAEEDLAPVVERCRLLLRHQAEMLGVSLEARTAPDLPRITCDAAQVQQVILALAMNALEATPLRRPGHAGGPPRRRGRRPRGLRHRVRHPQGAPGARLRALLHDQGGRQGRRASGSPSSTAS